MKIFGIFGTRKAEVLNSLIINTTAKANDATDILLCTEDDNSCYRNVFKMSVVSFALGVVFITLVCWFSNRVFIFDFPRVGILDMRSSHHVNTSRVQKCQRVAPSKAGVTLLKTWCFWAKLIS